LDNNVRGSSEHGTYQNLLRTLILLKPVRRSGFNGINGFNGKR